MKEAAWSALVDPNRRAILEMLRQRPCAVGELADELGFSQPMTSKHLRVLRESGLVSVRVDAQRRIYAIDPGGMAELDAWLAPYRRLWNDRLDALGRHLDHKEET
ncbi:ArsR/SmtB family transcription factor [Pseudonocardia cypriaca]|uniref:ArsR family transcriptional regulator n=1 Tax=Pseudonocardia cypriaca TaxID=882449 RepID=A0A543FVJ3_9PSEU|nr:metalloregulator ArsR/SmtB family transcription factor [Pseudonocardia cypriaca]TQM37833.1 ArsR family transcriptional regulator [Pseudonocardia cypriaca]